MNTKETELPIDQWHCNACGTLTGDISPLGPEGVVICEECADTKRSNPFVDQFRR